MSSLRQKNNTKPNQERSKDGWRECRMKAAMISINPKWCKLIASGKKTLEIRKTQPKLKPPFKCYIYCTNEKKLKFWTNKRYSYADDHSHNLFDRCGNGKVIGEFICDTMVVDKTYGHDSMFREMACMSQVEAASYCLNARMYGWHISKLVIYDEPKPLNKFVMAKTQHYCHLQRPPQSWCYVEEV